MWSRLGHLSHTRKALGVKNAIARIQAFEALKHGETLLCWQNVSEDVRDDAAGLL